jgi:hypothetical protein
MSHPPRNGNVSREFCRKCQGDFADTLSAEPSRSWPLLGEFPTILPKIRDIRPLTGGLYMA